MIFFEMVKVDPKTSNLATLQNFDVIEKMDAGFGISDPKLIIIKYKVFFAVDHCNGYNEPFYSGRLQLMFKEQLLDEFFSR